MASDAQAHVVAVEVAARSPWWYRHRALTIGAAFFCGFFFGPIVSGLLGLAVSPVFVQVGTRFGPGAERGALVAAVLLATGCWVIRMWGGAYLRPDVVWNMDALDDRLIVEGPFRFVRNPLYLGNVLLALAMSLYATPIGAVLIVAGNAIVIAGLVRVEERLLRARYGAAFDAYANAVPAVLPRLAPIREMPSRAVVPSFALGARSEAITALFVVGTIAFAVRFW